MNINNHACNICETDGKVLGVKLGVRAVRCPRCGFIWKDTRSLPVDYNKTWRYGSSESFDIRNMDSVFDYRLQKISNFSSCEVKKLMDFGCGQGKFVKYLRAKGYDAFGCDSGDNIPDDQFFFQQNISHVNEYNFDAIVTIETFEHIQDIKPVVTELVKRIRKDGLLYVETQFTHLDSILGWGYFDLANHIAFYSPKSMRVLLDNAGMDLIYFDNKIQPKNMLWFMRKFVHSSHVIIPDIVQKSWLYKSLLVFLEKTAKAVFGKKVVVIPCSDWVSDVLMTSNCVFVGRKR